MNDYQISKGYFGLLKEPVGDRTTDAWETRQNSLPDGFMLNYEGTMIISNDQKEAYDVDLIFVDPEAGDFRDQCDALGYEVEQVKFYACHWYNDSDSPMSIATKEEVFF